MLIFIILLLAAGLGLIMLEAFVPGGILGVLGGIAIAGGAVLCFMEYGAQAGGVYLVVSLVLGLIAGASAFWIAIRRFTLRAPNIQAGDEKDSLTGTRGKVVKVLDPTGTIEIEGRKHPARAESSLQSTEKGESVEVVGYDSIYLLVRRVVASEHTEPEQ